MTGAGRRGGGGGYKGTYGPMTGAGVRGGVIRGLKVTLHETNRNDDF